jgi:hypothetical protein
MRRRRPVLALVLLASLVGACRTSAPITPLPDDGAGLTSSLTFTSAKQAVVDFLNAYAEAPQDGGDALAATVGSTTLAEWAHWEALRFEGIGGGYTTTVDIAGITPITTQAGADGSPEMTVDLSAQIHFIHRDEDGQVLEFTRDFSGPATLAQQGVAAWALMDVTRDGAALSRRVVVPDEGTQAAGDVTLHLSSWFNYAPAGLFFNLRITNGTDRRVFVVPSTTGLRFDQQLLKPTQRIPLSAALPGEDLEFILFFRADDPLFTSEPESVALQVRLAGWPGAKTFTYPLLGSPPPTGEEPTGSEAPPSEEPSAAGTPIGGGEG